MTKQVKLFSQDPKTAGRTYTLPLVGDQTFDSKENFILVDEDKVEDFLSLDFGIIVSDKEKVVKEVIQDSEEVIMLKALSDDELSPLLEPYPKKETKTLKNRGEIINYLAQQMSK